MSGPLPFSLAGLDVRQLLDNSEALAFLHREELQNFISRGKQEIEAFEAEILPLRMQLLAADARLESLKSNLGVAMHILAPINLLPDELLHRIFRYICRGFWISSSSSRTPAHSLLQVCRRWHSIVMTSPTLWDSIHIDPALLPGANRIAPAERFQAFIKRFVKKSGSSLISVHFFLEQNQRSQEDVYLALEELIPTSNRWFHLEIIEELNPSGIDLNSDRFQPIHHNLTSLETLTIGYFPTASTILEDAPRLHSLRIVNPVAEPMYIVNLHPAMVRIPWHQLVHLTCEGMLARNILSFARASPNLEVLCIEDCMQPALPIGQSQVSMPRLRSLSVTRMWSPMDVVSREPMDITDDLLLFFETFIAVKLETLILCLSDHDFRMRNILIDVASFTNFVTAASSSLTVLSLSMIPILPEDLIETLKVLTRLETLSISFVKENRSTETLYYASYHGNLSTAFLDAFHSNDKPILIPCLQYLKLGFISLEEGLRDEALAAMIQWRYRNSRSLRFVDISLCNHMYSLGALEVFRSLKRDGLGISLEGIKGLVDL